MRNSLLILVLCLAAIAVGALMFLAPQSKGPATAVGEQSAQVAVAPVTEKAVPFTVIESGQQAGVSVRKNVAARDAASLKRIWDMAHDGEATAVPSVDFTKEYVIAVFAGDKSTGGHMIEVTNVTDLGDTRALSVSITSPGAGCVVTQAFTSPYQLIRVPLSTNYLKATDTAVTSDCQ